jgi:phosphate-selective porin OprO and OprP
MKNSIILIFFLLQAHIVLAKSSDILILAPELYAKTGVNYPDTMLKDSTSQNLSNSAFPLKLNAPLQLSGFTQIRYQHFDQSGSHDGFDIYHARLNLKGMITPVLTYRFQAEFSGKGAPKLSDAYAEWKLTSFLILTAGQFYIPLSIENMIPDEFMESVYRSQVINALANRSNDVMGDNSGRDIGAQISGSLLKLNKSNFIDYKFGVFNGAGINVTADNNNYKDLGGRLVLHPLSWIDLGASVYHGTAYYGAKPANHTHNRQGCDLNVTYRNFNFRTEYLQGQDSSNVRRSGYYIQSSYFIIPKKFEILLKYDSYDPNLAKVNNYFSDYTLSAGYNFTSTSRIQAAYVFRREHETQIMNNYAALRFQIGF